MNTKILNTWKSTRDNMTYYELGATIYKKGDWAAYSQWTGSIIYAYKDIAVSNLGGLNKEHIDRLASNQRPGGENDNSQFLFDRAIANRDYGLILLSMNQ